MINHLQHGRDCYRPLAWSDAYQAFLHADQSMPLEADDLDRLATSAYLTGWWRTAAAAVAYATSALPPRSLLPGHWEQQVAALGAVAADDK
ncbi:MAG: hypothetical protein ACREMA_20685 [Longimicrobiales bacterium]